MSEPRMWFSYDTGGNGFSLHATREEAKKAAEDALDAYRDDAPEGWSDDVEDVCYGQVLGRVVETYRKERPDGVALDEDRRGSDGVDYSDMPSGCDVLLDYGLEDYE
jgi:hypothetical protein